MKPDDLKSKKSKKLRLVSEFPSIYFTSFYESILEEHKEKQLL